MAPTELKEFLDEKVDQYNSPEFIPSDPIQVPHQYNLKEDIEIAGFLTATIAWGNRKSIITNGKDLMERMGNAPYDFIMNFSENDIPKLSGFVHRTFNDKDLIYFIKALQYIYKTHGGLEALFSLQAEAQSLQPAIHHFRNVFFSLQHMPRTRKHVSDPLKNSAAKRINMFLRWMIRKDSRGVDFGIWESLSPHQLSCPLDVHSGNVARKLKLLQRKQNDAKALIELDRALRRLDSLDPVKYDFALFGLGVFEKL